MSEVAYHTNRRPTKNLVLGLEGIPMSKPRQHVVPAGDQWGVRREGSERLTSIHPTQGEAIEAGREIARNQQTELVIHRPDGTIRDSDSYGNDPMPPRDRKH
jgi:hypothetical protein